MHLALIISSLNAGGAERVLSELANYWAEAAGHQVSILTLAPSESQPFYPLNSKIRLIQLDQSKPSTSHVMRLKDIFKRIFSLRKTIKKLQPNVIISFVDLMNVTTLISTLGMRIPVIVSERIDPHFHVLPKFFKWLRLKLYPLAFKLVVQTNSAASYFPISFKNLISVIPNPVKTPRMRKEEYAVEVKNIVTVGRLTLQKDHPTLIRAFARLLLEAPSLTLTIYGEGEDRSKLEQLIHSLNLHDKVHLPGLKEDIAMALQEADLFIFPSLYEGFPNALCEAMATGLPVIASNCSGNVDIVSDGINGRLFQVGDVDALTRSAAELLRNSLLRKYLGENAKAVSQQFILTSIFAKWDQILLDALKAEA